MRPWDFATRPWSGCTAAGRRRTAWAGLSSWPIPQIARHNHDTSLVWSSVVPPIPASSRNSVTFLCDEAAAR